MHYHRTVGQKPNKSTEEFAREAKLLPLAKLFELGRVSSGKAAEICNMTRV